MQMKLGGLVVCLVAVLAGCGTRSNSARQAVAVSPEAIVIRGAKLIDGSALPPTDNAVIVVDRGLIQAVGHAASTPVPEGAAVVNAQGKTVVPGLVDAHVHYFGGADAMRRAFKQQLAWGVTAVRSIGTDKPEHLAVIEEARAGRIEAPHIFTAGLGFTHPKGHPAAIEFVNRPATAAEARKQVDELAARKVNFIKMWVESKGGTLPKISPEIQLAIVDQARRHAIQVVAHIFDEADLRRLADAGVSDFLHTVRDKQFPDAALIGYAKNKSLVFTPTLSVIHSNWFFAEHPEELDDPQVRAVADESALAVFRSPQQRAARMIASDAAQRELSIAKRFVQALHKAEVRVVAGSDSNGGTIPHGWGTHHELELLVSAGLKPLEAIRAATGLAADAIALAPNFGRLRKGAAADLLVLGGNPEQDIRNTRRIERVMQGGRWLTTQQ